MKLLVQITPHEVLELDTPRNSVTVGRSPNSDLVIPHNSVSRTHCRIETSPKGIFLITDLDSTYGTYIDDDRLTPNSAASMLSVSQLTIGLLACELSESVAKPIPKTGPRAKTEGTQNLIAGSLTKRDQKLGVNDPSEIRRLEGTRTRIVGPRNPVSEDFALKDKELYFKDSKRPYVLMFIVVFMILMYLINIGIK
jgi:hypothetical protein